VLDMTTVLHELLVSTGSLLLQKCSSSFKRCQCESATATSSVFRCRNSITTQSQKHAADSALVQRSPKRIRSECGAQAEALQTTANGRDALNEFSMQLEGATMYTGGLHNKIQTSLCGLASHNCGGNERHNTCVGLHPFDCSPADLPSTLCDGLSSIAAPRQAGQSVP